MAECVPDLLKYLAEIEKRMPAPEPDRVFMCHAKADEVVAALKKRADIDSITLELSPVIGMPMSYAGVRIIPLPIGAKIRNKVTGDEAEIDASSIFACTFHWEVAR